MIVESKVVAVDLDGVIAEYHGWRGEDIFGAPLTGALEGLERFRSEGWRIIIHTTRSTESARAYMEKYGLPFDAINVGIDGLGGNPGKPIASAYLDDRAVAFRGNWDRAVERVLRSRPWTRTGIDVESPIEPPAVESGYRRIYYYKLVRDLIPEIIEKSGSCGNCSQVDKKEYRKLLVEKVREELDEYERASVDDRPGELVDLLELWQTLVNIDGFSLEELEIQRQNKAERRGAFSKRLFLRWVDEKLT